MSSAGQEAVELAASAGLILDDWQAAALDDALGEREDGKWSAFEVGLVLPRQNGKNGIIEARELAGLFLFGEELIIHSSHRFDTSREAFLRLKGLIEDTPDLARRVASVDTATGNEGIRLKSGARLRYKARSGNASRGFSGDLVILDEALNLADVAISAMVPTMSARPNPQLWLASSAPTTEVASLVLRRFCRRGRSGAPRIAYIEYCADAEAAHDDPVAWQTANPARGIRIFDEFIEAELAIMTPEDFARERLGIWFEDDTVGTEIIPAAAWAACLDQHSGPDDSKGLSFALDVSPDRTSASFAVAGTSKVGGTHLEVIDHRSGTGWLVERAVEIQKSWKGELAIAEGSPAWSLEPELTKAKVKIHPVSVAEHAQACGQLLDAVVDHQVRHIGQPELNIAVTGADRRYTGDAWLWSRKSSAIDISPLVAVTLAHHLAVNPTTPSVYEDRGLVVLG